MGAFINFHLIALPMSEMVGASSHVGSLMVSDVAALVIILIEIAMGLFLMESLRVTRLFPVIGMLDDVLRKRLGYVAFVILFALAGVEASLAYMRDMLAADSAALAQSLAGSVAVEAEFRWIPAVGQMVMGFMLPFALTFVAIPLESFIRSFRTVGGTTSSGGYRDIRGRCDCVTLHLRRPYLQFVGYLPVDRAPSSPGAFLSTPSPRRPLRPGAEP